MTDRPIDHATRAGVRHQLLEHALADLDAARDAEEVMRRGRATEHVMEGARLSTLDALLAYADLIDSFGWPIPARLKSEIDLHHISLGARYGPIAGPTSPLGSVVALSRSPAGET